MPDKADEPAIFRFGVFEAHTGSGDLRKRGLKVRLQDQPFQILITLLQHQGEIVTREELRLKLWPTDTFVDFDHGLNNSINKLRGALGDSAETPRFIETLPRRGYRFIGAVECEVPVTNSTSPASPLPPAADRAPWRRPYALVSGGAIAFAALLVVLSVVGLRTRWLERKGAIHVTSLVVLPFENLIGDPSQEYFVDGMTDALTSELAQIEALRVVSRTTAMQYKGTKERLNQIAREMNVDAIVEGSVRRSDKHVWITVELVEAATDRHIWGKVYERDLGDIPTLQSDAARGIAQEIRIRVSPQEKALLTNARPVNAEAYDAYLRGNYYANKRTPQGLKESITYFQQAIKKDPDYAVAFSGLANSYALLGFYGASPPKDSYPRARAAAETAIKLNDNLGEAHAAMAEVALWFDWDWEGAEHEFERALDLNPGDATARQHFADYLAAMGRFDESVEQSKRALQLDPLSLPISSNVGFMLYLARRYDQAIEQDRRTLDLDLHYAREHRDLSMVYAQTKSYKEAVTEGQKAIDLSDASPLMSAMLGYAYGESGDMNKAREILSEMKKLSMQQYVSPFYIAVVCAGMGRKDDAFASLEGAYAERSSQLAWLNIYPPFDNLRSDPRFDDLVRRVGLPESKTRTHRFTTASR